MQHGGSAPPVKRQRLDEAGAAAAAGSDVPASAILMNNQTHSNEGVAPINSGPMSAVKQEPAAPQLPAASATAPASAQAPSASPASSSVLAGSAASALPLSTLLRDPVVRRVHACFQAPNKYQQRFKRNWLTLGRLHAKLSEQHKLKAKNNAAVPAAEEPQIKSPGLKRQRSEGAPTSDIEPPAAAAAARARARLLLQSASKGLPDAPARSGATAAALRKAKRRRNLDPLAHMRPSSCPPDFVHDPTHHPPGLDAAAERDKWPKWMLEIASPRAKEEDEPMEQTAPPAGSLTAAATVPASRRRLPPRFSYDVPASALAAAGLPGSDEKKDGEETGLVTPKKPDPYSFAAGTVGAAAGAGGWHASVEGGAPGFARPPMARASTMHAISWLSASAPSTPATYGGYRELAIQPPAVAHSTSVGTRPTPLLLPSSASASAAALVSPMHRPLTAASPRFGDSTPRFGDSMLITSIPSSSSAAPAATDVSSVVAAAASMQRGFSMMSPVQRAHQHTPSLSATWPTHAVPPMSPIARQMSTPLHQQQNGGVTGAAAALLQEWRNLGASYVESVLRPPTLASLANATRKPVQMHAAALARFLPTSAESSLITMPAPSTPVHHSNSIRATPAATPAHASLAGSMPPPMSPLPPRRTSVQMMLPPLPPVPQSPVPALLRAQSEQNLLMRTPTHQGIAGSSGGSGSAAHGLPPMSVPISPNITRMSSWMHTHPTTPNRMGTTGSAHVTPMSPLGLAQPAPGSADMMLPPMARQASSSSSTQAIASSPNDAAAVPGAVAVVPEVAPVVPAQTHTCSRVGTDFQSDLPVMLTQKQREWEHSVYLHAHAAVHGFPKHLPPMPSGPPPPTPHLPPVPAPALVHQQSSASLAAGVSSPARSPPPAAAAAAAASNVSGFNPSYVPVPRVFPPPFALPAFPASASLVLTSKHSSLREKLMGGRKAARRKLQKESEEQRRMLELSGGGRDARKRSRDALRADEEVAAELGEQALAASRKPFKSAHPSFASFASLFPADSPFARMRFDDDTLSPYFVCSAFVRPHSPRGVPTLRRQGTSSPVHVLSVPPTPNNGPRKASLGAGERFPSSLLEPSMFNRRMAALARGDVPEDEEDEDDDDDEQDEREQRRRERELLALQMRRNRAQMSAMDEADEDGAAQHGASAFSAARPAHPHARAVRPAPRQAIVNGAKSAGFANNLGASSGARVAPGSGGGKSKRKGPSSSPSPSPGSLSGVSTAGVAPAASGGRYKRWKMVSGKRIVWWVDSNGREVAPDEKAMLQPQSEEQKQQPPAARSQPVVPKPTKRRAQPEFDSNADAAESPASRDTVDRNGSEVASDLGRNGADNDDAEAAVSSESDSSDASPGGAPRRIIIKRSRTAATPAEPEKEVDTAVAQQQLQPQAPASTSSSYQYHSASTSRPQRRIPSPAPRPSPPVPRAPAQQHLSDLSPAVRVSAARSGVQRMAACIDAVVEADDESMDESMERTIGMWREQTHASMAHA